LNITTSIYTKLLSSKLAQSFSLLYQYYTIITTMLARSVISIMQGKLDLQ